MAYGVAWTVLGDFQLAQDATQEAFITAYQKLDQLQTPQAFAGWLRRIVLTQCHRQTRRRTVPTRPIEAVPDVVSTERDPVEAVVVEEVTEQIFAAMRRLPEHQRRVTQLFYIDAYSQKEIAELLQVPVTTVNNWLHASRKRLKVALSPDLIEEGTFDLVRQRLQEGRLVTVEQLFNAIELGGHRERETPAYGRSNVELHQAQ